MNFKKYKLKDLIDNFSVRARDYGGSDGLEFLGVSNDNGIVKSKSAAEHKGEEYKIIEKGCFAYNPYRINVGSIAYLNEDIKGLISPAYVIFKTKENSIKDNLLFKFLKSAEGLRQIKFHGRGTVRQALRFEDLCKIEISLPSYEEQEILISNIEKTEFESNLISSELTHQLDLIKQLRQAFLREAMQGKLVDGSKLMVDGSETGHELLAKIKAEKQKSLPAGVKRRQEKELPPISEDEIPFEIPGHWAWCRLGEICTKVTDGFHNTPPKVLKGFPYIAATQVKSDKIDWDNCNYVEEKFHRELYNKTTPKKGEILVVNIGAGCGTPAIIDVDFEFSFKNTAILKFNQELIFNPLCI
ncbi:MAG: restriction endonuclease subunit S [Flavobacteriales bacterium]|nr:restriction endonuclease subunit S [Flavobacteriales bacterium]